MRRKRVMARSAAHTAELVHRHARSNPAAAEEHGAVGASAMERVRDIARGVGIVHGIGRVCSKVDRFMAHRAHHADDSVFERKSRMVGCNSNFHSSVFYRTPVYMPAACRN